MKTRPGEKGEISESQSNKNIRKDLCFLTLKG
jgi:hypothetical protein